MGFKRKYVSLKSEEIPKKKNSIVRKEDNKLPTGLIRRVNKKYDNCLRVHGFHRVKVNDHMQKRNNLEIIHYITKNKQRKSMKKKKADKCMHGSCAK